MQGNSTRAMDLGGDDETDSDVGFSFEPTAYLEPSGRRLIPSYGLITLNQESTSELPYSSFEILWQHASIRLCSDGGANVLLGWIKHFGQPLIPDAIIGDLDSLSLESKEYFSSHGCPIIKDSDQNTTDFTKCVQFIQNKDNGDVFDKKRKNVHTIWALGELGGRFDHTMGMIQTLYLFPSLELYILSRSALTFLIFKGKSKISMKRDLVGNHIGLLPIGYPVTNISTFGLKWNLTKGEILQFGGLVSTSNTFSEENSLDIGQIQIDTNEHLIFTISLPISL
jgi:thiamine pyrophosphokinase